MAARIGAGKSRGRSTGRAMATRGGVLHPAVGMRLSRQVQYALCGIFDLAYNGAGEPVHVRRIGERQRIPHRFLEQIFQRLRRAGLVTGKRGPGGGFVLTRPASQINLREVVEAVDGPIEGVGPPGVERGAGADPDAPHASRDGGGAHRPDFLWDELAARTAEMLAGIRVADVCREAVRRKVLRDLPTRFDYEI
jgi:Rrf2 family protein